MLWGIDLIILSAIFTLTLYFYFTRNFAHWTQRNVEFIKPIPFFGNILDIFLLQKSIGELCAEIYTKTAKPFVGFFVCDEPYLLIRDVDLIKTILVKDFSVFNDRTMTENKKDDPMGSHILFILKNPDWKNIRRKITPVFTSGRMRLMYTLMKQTGDDLLKFLDMNMAASQTRGAMVVETREVSAKYTTDAISSTSFGINANCFENENAEFRQVSRRIFNWDIFERGVSTTCYFVAPALVRLFRLKFIDSFSSNFLRKAFWSTMHERENSKIVRHDLLDILIEMRRNEDIDDPHKLEGDKLVAQATQFFIAGYETSSTTISFALYELALNPKVQEKVRDEIVRVVNKHGGEISYDALKEMEYLDNVIKETLRKYPVLPFLDRRCNIDYEIPGTDVVLNKGTGVFIPVLALHYDPQFFPEPDKFEPDRFLVDIKNTKLQFAYLPFGEGPRNCIGARFGTLSSKSALAHILQKYEIDVCSETQIPMKFNPRGFLIAPDNNKLNLKFKNIVK